MNKSLLFAALGLVGLGAAAQEVGTVISSTPVVHQVAVPRQVCNPVMAQPRTSGGGGILGAIAGAAIGSQIGAGSGRGVATVLGTMGGAVLGNSIESDAARGQAYTQCTTQTTYENRTVYNVTYETGGRQYTTQLPYDPGPTVRLQGGVASADLGTPGPVVTAPPVQGAAAPVVVQSAPPMAPPAVVAQAPVYVQPAPVMVAPPVVYGYPAYPAYPYYNAYPPVGLSLSFGFGGGHHHRHWR